MDELLKFLRAFAGTLTTEDAASLANVIKTSANLQPVYQSIYDSGHSDATQRHKPREKELEKERDREKARADKTETDLRIVKQDAPDVQKIEQKYKDELARQTEEIKDLKKNHKAERERWHVDQAAAQLTAALVKRGVDPEWAEYLASKPENRQRLKATGTDDTIKVEVLKAGSEVPLQSDKPIEAYADELRRGVKATYITSKSDGDGSESRTGGGGGESLYDKIRDEQKKANEVKNTGKSGIDRLSGATA